MIEQNKTKTTTTRKQQQQQQQQQNWQGPKDLPGMKSSCPHLEIV